jgi:hypothetical protein
MRALTALGTANSLPSPRTKDSAEEPVDPRRSTSTHVQDERVRVAPASHPTLSSSATGNSEPRNTSEASQCPTQERRLGSARSLGGSLPRRLVPHIPTELADAPSDRRSQLRKLARSKVSIRTMSKLMRNRQGCRKPSIMSAPPLVPRCGSAVRLSRRSSTLCHDVPPSCAQESAKAPDRVRVGYR